MRVEVNEHLFNYSKFGCLCEQGKQMPCFSVVILYQLNIKLHAYKIMYNISVMFEKTFCLYYYYLFLYREGHEQQGDLAVRLELTNG